MLVLDWGMNVYKMLKFTPVNRRLFHVASREIIVKL